MKRYWCCKYCGKLFSRDDDLSDDSRHICPETGIVNFCIEPPDDLMAPLENVISVKITGPNVKTEG